MTRFNAAGKIDRRFGAGGTVETGLSTPRGAVSSDGGIVVAEATGDQFRREIVVLRLTARGERDTSFGASGRAATSIGFAGDYVTAVEVDADDRVLVATSEGWIYRYTAAGALDPGFGAGGRTRPLFSESALLGIAALAVQTDGRIVLAGERRPRPDTGAALLLARLLPDGTVDRAFGGVAGAGRVIDDSPDWREAFGVAVGDGGEIVATGSSCTIRVFVCRPALWRIPSSGDPVGPLFPVGPGSGSRLALDRRGGIVLLGSEGLTSFSAFLVRLDRDGRIDPGFGRGGKVAWPKGRAAVGPLILEDGRIVVAMQQALGGEDPETEQPNDVTVVRLVALWGGYDRRPPVIRLFDRSCAGEAATVRLRVIDRSRLRRLHVTLGGRRPAVGRRARITLRLGRPRRLRVIAVDQAGNRAERAKLIRACG